MGTCLRPRGTTPVHKGRCERSPAAHPRRCGLRPAARCGGRRRRALGRGRGFGVGCPVTGYPTESRLPGCSHWRTPATRPQRGIRPLARLGSTGPARRWHLASPVLSPSPVGGSGASMSAPKRRPLRCEQKGSHGAARCARLPGLEPSSNGPRRSDPPCNARVRLIWGTASGRAAASGAGRRWRTRCCCSARLAPGRARAS